MAFCKKTIGKYAWKSVENKDVSKFLCFYLMYQMLGWDHKAVILPKFTENSSVHQEGLGKLEGARCLMLKQRKWKRSLSVLVLGGAVGRARQRARGGGGLGHSRRRGSNVCPILLGHKVRLGERNVLRWWGGLSFPGNHGRSLRCRVDPL